MKRKDIRIFIAVMVLLSMIFQVCIPVGASTEESIPDVAYQEEDLVPEDVAQDAFDDITVTEPEDAIPDGLDIQTEPVDAGLFDEGDLPIEDGNTDIIPEAVVTEAESFSEDGSAEVPDVADAIKDLADDIVLEEQVTDEDSVVLEDYFDVSEPDSNLMDYYQEPAEGINTDDPLWDNSSIRGLNLSNKEPAKLEGYNFVLFGLSGHNSGDDDRSDTIMIITVDPDREEIKLTSILRDTKAAITGHEPQKINAAYKYGGAELALETINKNFSLSLDQYVTVDFKTLEDIVDLLDGVEIELAPEEAEFINIYSTEPVEEGVNILNGEQALLYCRIRKTDSDTVRAGRQQRVIQEILTRLKGSSLLVWLRVLVKVIETSEISMPILDIIKVISLPLATYKLVNNIVPDIEYETDLTSMIDEHGEWVWVYDLEKAGDRIVDIINNQ